MRQSGSRPKFLDLTRIRQPVGAIVSIAHRISGILLFLLIPVVIYLLELSLKSESGYAQVMVLFDSTAMKLLAWIGIWSLIHHMLAGIRFLLLDVEIGVERRAARQSAMAVNVISGISLLLTAMWIFL